MRGAQAMKRPSVPPPACEAAEEDEADQGDDQPSQRLHRIATTMPTITMMPPVEMPPILRSAISSSLPWVGSGSSTPSCTHGIPFRPRTTPTFS
jgi:hypothetical protein